jgi:hypothetical protein
LSSPESELWLSPSSKLPFTRVGGLCCLQRRPVG